MGPLRPETAADDLANDGVIIELCEEEEESTPAAETGAKTWICTNLEALNISPGANGSNLGIEPVSAEARRLATPLSLSSETPLAPEKKQMKASSSYIWHFLEANKKGKNRLFLFLGRKGGKKFSFVLILGRESRKFAAADHSYLKTIAFNSSKMCTAMVVSPRKT